MRRSTLLYRKKQLADAVTALGEATGGITEIRRKGLTWFKSTEQEIIDQDAAFKTEGDLGTYLVKEYWNTHRYLLIPA